MMGASTASSDSCTFSIMTLMPPSRHFSMMLSSFLLSSLVVCRLFELSFSLTQTMPCSWGSIIRGQRSAVTLMAAFSTETRSAGKPCEPHSATVDGEARRTKGSGFSDSGTPFLERKGVMVSTMSLSRNFLLKHPTYDTNDADSSTSPGSSLASSFILATLTFQRACSEPSAAIKRWASDSLLKSRSPSATTRFFSATTLSYSAMRTASLASRSAT
jgi:hypothetical protein